MLSKLILLQISRIEQYLTVLSVNKRLKITSFDICSSYIVAGCNSGTLYFLDHESLQILFQLSTQNGRIIEISISPDEGHVAYANNSGHVFITKVPGQASSSSIHPVSSSEHEGYEITVLTWSLNGSELYIGDKNGNLSVLNAPSSFASSFLMNLTHHLMHLESCIVQLDVHEHYLLVSTVTKSYVCNTRLETYSQIGTKPRNGVYGGCFCTVNSHRNLMLLCQSANVGVSVTGVEISSGSVTKKTSVAKPLKDVPKFKSVISPKLEGKEVNLEEEDIFNERSIMNLMCKMETRIFCSRPGSRMWESDLKGKVLATHQLKYALAQPPFPVIELKDDILNEDCNERQFHQHLNDNFSQISLRHVIKFYDDYIIATSTIGLHLIDPQHSKIILWTFVKGGIESIKVHGNIILYRTCATGQLSKLIITTADIAIMTLHSKELYEKCATLCIKYGSLFHSSYLLKQFGKNIIKDLLRQLNNKELIQGIDNIRKNLLTSDFVGKKISSCIKIERPPQNSIKRRHYFTYDKIANSFNSDGEYSTPEESICRSGYLNKINPQKNVDIPDGCFSIKSQNAEILGDEKLIINENDNSLNSRYGECHKTAEMPKKSSPFHFQSRPIRVNFASSLISSLASSTKSVRNTLKESLSFKKTEEFVKKLDYTVNGYDFESPDTRVTVCNSDQLFVEEPIVIVPASKKNRNHRKSFPNQNFSEEVELKKIMPQIPNCLHSYHNIVSETLGKVPYCESHAELDSVLLLWLNQFIDTVMDLKGKSLGFNDDSFQDECDFTIDFECSSLSGVRKDSTKLFILCFKRRIFVYDKVVNSKYLSQYPQHFLTPEITKNVDSFYATIIENDLGFFDYSSILDNLTSINANLLFHSWISLLKRVAEEPTNKYVSDVGFSHLHRLLYLKKLLTTPKSLSEFLAAVSKIVHSVVLYDIFYFILYLSCSNTSLSWILKDNTNLVMNHFLVEIYKTKCIETLYFEQWSECPEIQYEIIAALLFNMDEKPNKCSCGFPHPATQCTLPSNCLKCLFNLPIYHPREVSTLCQSKGFYYGFISTNMKYNLCDIRKMIDIALQTACQDNIILLFEYLEEKDFLCLLKSLYELKGSSDVYLKCLNCSFALKIDYPQKAHDRMENVLLLSYSALCDFVLSSILQYKGSLFTFQLLSANSFVISLHSFNKLFFGKLIMCSLVERVGPNFHAALMKNFTGIPCSTISINVLIAFDDILKRNNYYENRIVAGKDLLVSKSSTVSISASSTNERNIEDFNSDFIKNNKLSEIALTDTSIQPRQAGTGHSGGSHNVVTFRPPTNHHPNDNRFCHHWGVRVQILTGICQLCRLGLTVEVMVNAGGLTIFSCGHAYHTVCLLHHGRSCIVCLDNREN